MKKIIPKFRLYYVSPRSLKREMYGDQEDESMISEESVDVNSCSSHLVGLTLEIDGEEIAFNRVESMVISENFRWGAPHKYDRLTVGFRWLMADENRVEKIGITEKEFREKFDVPR